MYFFYCFFSSFPYIFSQNSHQPNIGNLFFFFKINKLSNYSKKEKSLFKVNSQKTLFYILNNKKLFLKTKVQIS